MPLRGLLAFILKGKFGLWLFVIVVAEQYVLAWCHVELSEHAGENSGVVDSLVRGT